MSKLIQTTRCQVFSLLVAAVAMVSCGTSASPQNIPSSQPSPDGNKPGAAQEGPSLTGAFGAFSFSAKEAVYNVTDANAAHANDGRYDVLVVIGDQAGVCDAVKGGKYGGQLVTANLVNQKGPVTDGNLTIYSSQGNIPSDVTAWAQVSFSHVPFTGDASASVDAVSGTATVISASSVATHAGIESFSESRLFRSLDRSYKRHLLR